VGWVQRVLGGMRGFCGDDFRCDWLGCRRYVRTYVCQHAYRSDREVGNKQTSYIIQQAKAIIFGMCRVAQPVTDVMTLISDTS